MLDPDVFIQRLNRQIVLARKAYTRAGEQFHAVFEESRSRRISSNLRLRAAGKEYIRALGRYTQAVREFNEYILMQAAERRHSSGAVLHKRDASEFVESLPGRETDHSTPERG
jgi:hypothetical protein